VPFVPDTFFLTDFVSPMLPKQTTAASGPAQRSQRELNRSPHIPKENWLMDVVNCQRKKTAQHWSDKTI
jgi:hypothetical protein